MECADLERYLEAVLDNRLGRTRLAVLKRHLVGCGICRARVERLRHFERDLHRRMRAGERAQSFWSGLDLDLVRSTSVGAPVVPAPLRLLPAPARGATSQQGVPPALPPARAEPERAAPPAAARRRPRARLVGLVLALTTVGTVVPWLLLQLEAGAHAGGRLAVDRADLATVDALPLRTGDPDVLRGWLQAQTGVAFPVPAWREGFELQGARITHEGGRPSAVIGYRHDGAGTVLYLRPEPDARDRPAEARVGEHGLTTVRWTRQGFDAALLTALMPERATAALAALTAGP